LIWVNLAGRSCSTMSLGIFKRPEQFPAPEEDLPLSKEARQFYKSGDPFLQRYLPFWLAVLSGRLLMLLIPVVGMAYPLLRLAPTACGWGMRRRILRLYGELKIIELVFEAHGRSATVDARSARSPAGAAHFRYLAIYVAHSYQPGAKRLMESVHKPRCADAAAE